MLAHDFDSIKPDRTRRSEYNYLPSSLHFPLLYHF
jgi:hypothetical protein